MGFIKIKTKENLNGLYIKLDYTKIESTFMKKEKAGNA